MESLLNRYRNITVLLLVIMAQLVLLAVSAKNDQDVRFIRIWTVTAVTPVARIIEGVRGGGSGFLHNYILLHDTNQENLRLRSERDKLKMENVFLKNELNTADRAKALALFQSRTPSKTLAARIIGTGAGANSKVVFVDRGTAAGVQRGMGVVTPDGIVGKVIAAYPTASQVALITDSDFAAGVITQKGAVHGTLKGQGSPQCRVDYVAVEEKVEVGELLFTSGDDRIFPRGFAAGVVKAVRPGQPFQEILAEPTGLQRGLEDVLILVEGVHQTIPDAPSGMQPVYIAPPPPGSAAKPADAAPAKPLGTEADRLRSQYKTLGEEQKHTYGDNPPGTKAVDFTKLGLQPGTGGRNPAPAGQAPAAGIAAPSRAGAAPPTPATGSSAPATERPAKPAVRQPAGTAPAPAERGAPGTLAPSRAGAAPLTPATVKPANPAAQQPAAQGAPRTAPSGAGTAPRSTPGTGPSEPATGKPANPTAPGGTAAPATPGTVRPSTVRPGTVKPENPPAQPPPGRGASGADAARRTNQTAGAPPGGQLR